MVESSVLFISDRAIPWVFCMPSSVGCQMGCRICAMPQSREPRPLTKQELWAILEHSLGMAGHIETFQVSFMGQGEPLLNTANVFDFCSELLQLFPDATVGISTVGVADAIRELGRQSWAGSAKLQLSLHAWPSIKRQQITPAEEEYPVEHAVAEAGKFARKWGTRCCLNCVLLKDTNDSESDARSIAQVAEPDAFYVKVSEYNPEPHRPFLPATEARTQQFCDVLRGYKIAVHRFRSVGTKIGAGCGQTRLGRNEPSHSKGVCAEGSVSSSSSPSMNQQIPFGFPSAFVSHLSTRTEPNRPWKPALSPSVAPEALGKA